jgi:hypothetical protein
MAITAQQLIEAALQGFSSREEVTLVDDIVAAVGKGRLLNAIGEDTAKEHFGLLTDDEAKEKYGQEES